MLADGHATLRVGRTTSQHGWDALVAWNANADEASVAACFIGTYGTAGSACTR
jgi:hypothetical protein